MISEEHKFLFLLSHRYIEDDLDIIFVEPNRKHGYCIWRRHKSPDWHAYHESERKSVPDEDIVGPNKSKKRMFQWCVAHWIRNYLTN